MVILRTDKQRHKKTENAKVGERTGRGRIAAVIDHNTIDEKRKRRKTWERTWQHTQTGREERGEETGEWRQESGEGPEKRKMKAKEQWEREIHEKQRERER